MGTRAPRGTLNLTLGEVMRALPEAFRGVPARPCGAAGINTPGGKLAQTPGEVCWLSLWSVCAVLGRLQRAHVAARTHSARVLLLLLSQGSQRHI